MTVHAVSPTHDSMEHTEGLFDLLIRCQKLESLNCSELKQKEGLVEKLMSRSQLSIAMWLTRCGSSQSACEAREVGKRRVEKTHAAFNRLLLAEVGYQHLEWAFRKNPVVPLQIQSQGFKCI